MTTKNATKPGKFSFCVGGNGFVPSERVLDKDAHEETLELLKKDDFQGAIARWFKIPLTDTYVYHAMGSVRLAEVQHVIGLGSKNGLHDWYRDSEGNPLPPPPPTDTQAYTTIFAPSTSTPSTLKSLLANAKKSSLRASIATHLTATRFLHPLLPSLSIPKLKSSPPPNPYLAFWSWSCQALEWAGPSPASARTSQAHHVLPVLMHHFGCACPSYEALEILRLLSAGRTVVDMGSGNGYWAFMLRQHGVEVVAVDNAQSEWRVSWLGPGETTIADGAAWLGRKANGGGRDMVLLMVYPVVGGGVGGGVEGGFTRDLLAAYRGDTVAVVGTQNHNGYTGFKDMTMAEYMAKEQPEWTRVVQIPLPSFAGKDDALFVFQRGKRVPKDEGSNS